MYGSKCHVVRSFVWRRRVEEGSGGRVRGHPGRRGEEVGRGEAPPPTRGPCFVGGNPFTRTPSTSPFFQGMLTLSR
jgi:hypothetical protein